MSIEGKEIIIITKNKGKRAGKVESIGDLFGRQAITLLGTDVTPFSKTHVYVDEIQIIDESKPKS